MPYHFDESAYPPANPDVYQQRVRVGLARMAASRVVICGLARDLGEGVVAAMLAIEAIGGLFADWSCVLFENDSQDDTRVRLQSWAVAQRPGRVAVLTEDKGWPKWGPVRDRNRTTQMAYYREQYRRWVVEYAAADYAVVLDLDIGRYSLEGLADSFGWESELEWDAMASNGLATVRGRVVQYDAFAARDLGHPQPMGPREINPRVYHRGDKPVRMLSAFGGMAVYNFAAFARNSYAGHDCEHVPFHLGMDKVYLSPSQIVLY